MPPAFSKNLPFFLSIDDKARLQKLAPLFHIDFSMLDDETYLLHHAHGGPGEEVRLPTAMAHRRLLAEVCAKAAKWVHFHLAESCRDSLLGRSDANLRRVAELYVRDREASLGLTSPGG